MTKDITLSSLQDACQERNRAWDPENKFTPEFFAMEHAGEVGEAMNVHKKLLREKLGARGSRASIVDLADEMADDLVTLMNWANSMDIDLTEAVIKKFNESSAKNGFEHRL